jgi:hypothetical protein
MAVCVTISIVVKCYNTFWGYHYKSICHFGKALRGKKYT